MPPTCTSAALSVLAFAPAVAQKVKLTTYTAIENDQLAAFKAEIEKAVPEVEIEWVRDSTGVITARILAEKAGPKADLVLGLAASSLLLFKKHGLLEAYQPKGSDGLKPTFRSDDGSWTGMDAFLGVICYNTVEGQKACLTTPKTWKDLLDPKYAGKIVMPHPASSGTGYLMVAAWLQMMGDKAGWEYMDALHQNVAVYTHSGSAPCVQAAKGERVVGIGFDMRGAREKSNGAPIDIVVPAEGTRSLMPHWKSGFYHIAVSAQVPIVMAYMDYEKKRSGLGAIFEPTGDIDADMVAIKAFYAPFKGRNASQFHAD